jgi:hypothetical protein
MRILASQACEMIATDEDSKSGAKWRRPKQVQPAQQRRATQPSDTPPSGIGQPSDAEHVAVEGLTSRRKDIHQSPADPAARTGAAGKARAVGMCKKKAQTNAEISPSNASPYRPPEKLPVTSFITPTYQGPKKPPRFPIELIQAMAAAAAVPVRNIGGIAQNGPLDP